VPLSAEEERLFGIGSAEELERHFGSLDAACRRAIRGGFVQSEQVIAWAAEQESLGSLIDFLTVFVRERKRREEP